MRRQRCPGGILPVRPVHTPAPAGRTRAREREGPPRRHGRTQRFALRASPPAVPQILRNVATFSAKALRSLLTLSIARRGGPALRDASAREESDPHRPGTGGSGRRARGWGEPRTLSLPACAPDGSGPGGANKKTIVCRKGAPGGARGAPPPGLKKDVGLTSLVTRTRKSASVHRGKVRKAEKACNLQTYSEKAPRGARL